ncbi:MAG TPA: PAS domain S-box protein, partial [Polyangiaceae bacterium]|nr:PAS domain S-box protein [Polyangiaceae bacterium]
MAISLRILVIADSDPEAAALVETLGGGRYSTSYARVDDEARCRVLLEGAGWDAVVCIFPSARPPLALRALRARRDGVDPPLLIVAEAYEEVAEAAQRLGGIVCLRQRGLAHLGPALERVLFERERRSERAKSTEFEAGQRAILELIAAGGRLADVLEEIVLLIERQGDGMLCSILLLDEGGLHVRHGAAPHLPRPLVEGVDGSAIGPHEGSCGAAAYLREPVIVADIGTHPNWKDYRHLVVPFGIRACWSSPIVPKPGAGVLGTFAMYYRVAREPTAAERRWVSCATHLAAVAIQRDVAERAVRDSDARYRQIVDTAYEGIWVIDAGARTLFTNDRTAHMLGYDPAELRGRRIVDFMDEDSRRSAEGSFLERLRTISEQYESRFRRKDGTYFWALISGSPIRNEGGETVGALIMITDITDLKHTEEALRQSEAEFRVLFEDAAIGMAVLDEQGQVVRSNPALQRFLGYNEAELRALTFAALAHPDDGTDRQFYRDLVEGERETYRGERRYLRKNGDVVWGRLTASLVRPSPRQPRSLIVMMENVTARRQLEEAVRASERLRALMYGAVSDVLFYLEVGPNDSFRFLSVNPAFLRATGLEEADVIGRNVAEVIPEPSLSLVRSNYVRAIQEGRTITWDEVTAYPAGEKYGEVSITPIFDALGTCTNLVGMVHDITERRLAERRAEAQAALLDKARDAILVRRLDGLIEYWNQGAERVYGWSAQEAVGKRIVDLVHQGSHAFEQAQRELLLHGQWSGELVQRDKAGRRIDVDCSWTLIRDEQQRPRSVLVINSDITEKKSLEAQVFRTQRLESLGLLAGGVAHDFNNVLMAIGANAELAQETLGGDRVALDALSQIQQATQRGRDLARRLLTFSRGQESKRSPVALAPLVVEALDLLRATVPKSVQIETHFEAGLPDILADATQLHQIVMNLGANAAHAMGDRQGTIYVRVERAVLERDVSVHAGVLHPGTYVRLVVADTGVGMDKATLDHIFDPFFTSKGPGE